MKEYNTEEKSPKKRKRLKDIEKFEYWISTHKWVLFNNALGQCFCVLNDVSVVVAVEREKTVVKQKENEKKLLKKEKKGIWKKTLSYSDYNGYILVKPEQKDISYKNSIFWCYFIYLIDL